MSVSLIALLFTASALSGGAAGQSAGEAPPPPVMVPLQTPPPETTPLPPPPPPRATRGASRSAARAAAQPLAPLQSLITPEDYPASALAGREQGRPSFRLAVGADGRVAGCVILTSTGSAALDGTTCRILRARARFTPARDAGGNPVADEYFGQLAWRLPR